MITKDIHAEPHEIKGFALFTEYLRFMIPDEEMKEILSQEECELQPDFLGFVNVYEPLSDLIPEHKIVIDFGCYLAAQSYFFSEHKAYIGVDSVSMKRFAPENAIHFEMSIQDFIAKELPGLLEEHDIGEFCAICSYVNDFEATKLVRETFPNVFCYYPS